MGCWDGLGWVWVSVVHCVTPAEHNKTGTAIPHRHAFANDGFRMRRRNLEAVHREWRDRCPRPLSGGVAKVTCVVDVSPNERQTCRVLGVWWMSMCLRRTRSGEFPYRTSVAFCCRSRHAARREIFSITRKGVSKHRRALDGVLVGVAAWRSTDKPLTAFCVRSVASCWGRCAAKRRPPFKVTPV